MKEKLVKILFELSEDWHGCSTETLWAKTVGGDLYRLDNSPFYAKGVSFGDVVTARIKDGVLKYDAVFKRGGHSTYRIIVDHAKTSINEFQKHWQNLSQLACTYEGGPDIQSADQELKIYSIDVHPEANVDKVYELLQAGEAARIWEFEEGHCYENKSS